MENVTGYGIPRYNYVDNVENGSVQAQVVLPDMRVFTGNFAPTRAQVSEIIRLIFYWFMVLPSAFTGHQCS
jgi:hypothetical protein